MSLPTTPHRWAPQLRAWRETGTGTGQFLPDPNINVIHADWSLATVASVAVVDVAIDTDMSLTTALQRYHHGIRICIALDETVVFDGYPQQREYRRTTRKGHGQTAEDRLQITLEHTLHQLGKCEQSYISGCYTRRSSNNENSGGSLNNVAVAEPFDGISCCFNENGNANRARDLLNVAQNNNGAIQIPIFGNGTDTSNVPWTVGDALSYLLYFHASDSAGFDRLALIRQIQKAASHISDDDALRSVLQRELNHELIKERFLLDVLREWSQRFEIQIVQQATIRNGIILNEWTIRSDRVAPTGRLPHRDVPRNDVGAPLATPKSTRYGDRVAAAGADDVRIYWDDSVIKPVTIVRGGRRRYTFQAELMPGWLPETGLDNLEASDRTSAKSITLSDADIESMGIALQDETWFQQYHRDGQLFDMHRDVARKWVLNEGGDYASEEFARNAPFADYAPFDFSKLAAGRWTKRRRQLLPTFEATTNGREGVRVEVSFDNGSNWFALRDHYDLLSDECGIWFNASNLLNVAVPELGNVNLWYALVDQTMRVRVTASVESDERVSVRLTQTGASHPNGGVAHVRDDARYQSWFDTDGSALRDDEAMLRRDGRAIAAQAGQRRLRAELHYPWLETGLAPGQRVHGLLGPVGTFESNRPATGVDPFIERIRFINTPNGYGTRYFLGSRNS